MKKKFCWISLLALFINVIAYLLFMMILGGGQYESAIWYAWIILCSISPIAPIIAKCYRVKRVQSGMALEIIAIIISLFNVANLCMYGLGMVHGDTVGWVVTIISAVIYALSAKEPAKEQNHSARTCKCCGAKIPNNDRICPLCGTECL